MAEITRLSGLNKPLSDEQKIRAAEDVRAFAKSDGMVAFQHFLETQRREVFNEFYKAAKLTHIQLAEYGGVLRMIENTYGIFDRILTEAEKFNRE